MSSYTIRKFSEMNLGGITPDSGGNRIYRYELVKDKLTNAKLLLDLPALPEPRHNGGKITIGPDNSLYIAIGDVGGSFVTTDSETEAQNYVNGRKLTEEFLSLGLPKMVILSVME